MGLVRGLPLFSKTRATAVLGEALHVVWSCSEVRQKDNSKNKGIDTCLLHSKRLLVVDSRGLVFIIHSFYFPIIFENCHNKVLTLSLTWAIRLSTGEVEYLLAEVRPLLFA